LLKARIVRRLRAIGRRGTLSGVVALISLLVAILALRQSQSAVDEVRSSDLQASATVDIRDGTYNGQTVRLAISNVGLRPVIVSGVRLLVDGVVLAQAGGYLGDTTLLDRVPVDVDGIARSRRPFPLTLQPRTGMPLGVLFEDFESTGRGGRAYWQYAKSVRKFCNFIVRNPDARRGSPENKDIEMSVEYLPEGKILAPVTVLSTVGLVLDRSWPTVLRGKLREPSSIEVFQPSQVSGEDVGLPDLNGIRMLRLKLWWPGVSRAYTTERPQIGGEPTRLPLPELKHGIPYTYLVLAQGQAIAAGHFEAPLETPLDREDNTIDQEARTYCHRVLAGEFFF